MTNRVEVDLATRCECGSLKGIDTPIHGGQSVRRDCKACRTFLDFPVWYGVEEGKEVTDENAV